MLANRRPSATAKGKTAQVRHVSRLAWSIQSVQSVSTSSNLEFSREAGGFSVAGPRRSQCRVGRGWARKRGLAPPNSTGLACRSAGVPPAVFPMESKSKAEGPCSQPGGPSHADSTGLRRAYARVHVSARNAPAKPRSPSPAQPVARGASASQPLVQRVRRTSATRRAPHTHAQGSPTLRPMAARSRSFDAPHAVHRSSAGFLPRSSRGR